MMMLASLQLLCYTALFATAINAFTISPTGVVRPMMATTTSSRTPANVGGGRYSSSLSWLLLHAESSSTTEADATTEIEVVVANDGRSVYEKLGVTKDQLGMGVNPEEVLQWIGTREDMVEKVLQDISKFDRVKAEQEVDKYLKDPELMNYHIEFKKRLAENPNLLDPPEEEGFFSFRTVVIAYIAYVAGEILYRNVLREKGIDLDFVPGWALPTPPTPDDVAGTEQAVSDALVDAASAAASAASVVVDAVSNSLYM